MKLSLPKFFPVTCHTDFVGPGSIFVAIKGYDSDGICYIPDAIQRGATQIVVQKDIILSDDIALLIKKHKVKLKYVDDTRLALAKLSAQVASYQAKQLKIIGITGTKGKTTTAFLLEHILRGAGYKVALISTVNNKIDGYDLPPSLTTPQPDYLHQFLKLCVEQNVQYVVMEVAAQALTLHRVAGIEFDGIIFTNLALEHLEFYDSMEDYFAAKCALFNQSKKNAPCLVNADDEWGKDILKNNSNMLSFGMRAQQLDFRALNIVDIKNKLSFDSIINNTSYSFVLTSLFGNFNVYNALAAIAMAFKLGLDYTIIKKTLQIFPGIRGRLERHSLPNGATCIIDYAHNPLSYQAVLSVLRKLTDNLIVVFGAGGERDPSRRPLMGSIAAKYSDLIILTSDNPRTEDPHEIIDDIVNGVSEEHHKKIIKEIDRKKAIEMAYELSTSTTIITILGKGPDEYQIIGKTKTYFSEVEIIKALQ